MVCSEMIRLFTLLLWLNVNFKERDQSQLKPKMRTLYNTFKRKKQIYDKRTRVRCQQDTHRLESQETDESKSI